ncbi:MAG: metallophosphoesterase family protein [bacterium]|nr:metallophosphoesterase family protein [bacterium]
MKIGLMSDSHNNIEWVEEVVTWFQTTKVDKIIHLGDEWEDVVKWPDIIRVPGTNTEHYKNPDIPNRFILEFNGWNVLITHTKESNKEDLSGDINPKEAIKSNSVNVVLYGHTHIPSIERVKGIIYINPGHLKPEDKRGSAPSFAILNFEKGMLGVNIIDFKTKNIVLSKFFTK